jgi:hypothetical protein
MHAYKNLTASWSGLGMPLAMLEKALIATLKAMICQKLLQKLIIELIVDS